MEKVDSTEVSETGEGEGLEAGLKGLDMKDPKEQVTHSSQHIIIPSLQPRTEYLEWAEYFLAVSFLSAMRSKDPATQVLRLCLRLCLNLHFHLLLYLHLLMIRLELV